MAEPGMNKIVTSIGVNDYLFTVFKWCFCVHNPSGFNHQKRHLTLKNEKDEKE